jgi:nicotinate-nucleotide adenylyltransferase
LAKHFCALFNTQSVRLIPAGNPWQKKPLLSSGTERIAMLQEAFADSGLTVSIDTQEIERTGATYSVDTLLNIRREVGNKCPIIFIMGADQLAKLNTWHRWQDILKLTSLAVTTRPGAPDPLEDLPEILAQTIVPRIADSQTLTSTPYGKILIDRTLHLDVSSTQIRQALADGKDVRQWLPPTVLAYIKAHKLYRKPK